MSCETVCASNARKKQAIKENHQGKLTDMAFWQMSQMMERMMQEYMREMAQHSNSFAPYLRDADHFMVQVANSSQVTNDDRKFAINIDVSQFRPEELKVNLNGRVLTIEGNQERKDDHSYLARNFNRTWTLPEDVDVEALRTELTDKGNLIVEAPKIPNPNRRNIPIQRSDRGSL